MFPYLIIIITIEILFIIVLIKVCLVLSAYNAVMPEIKNLVISKIKEIRVEFEVLNKRIERQKSRPLTSNELGQIVSGIIIRAFIRKRLSLLDLVFTLFKHRKRIFSLVASYS